MWYIKIVTKCFEGKENYLLAKTHFSKNKTNKKPVKHTHTYMLI